MFAPAASRTITQPLCPTASRLGFQRTTQKTLPVRDESPTHIRELLGEAAWARLHPAVRERFGDAPKSGETWLFRGLMEAVHRTFSGWVMAELARLLGAPIPPHQGEDVPVDVLYYKAPCGGLVWERRFRFPGRPLFTASTVKRADTSGQLLEWFGQLGPIGAGMTLQLSEHGGTLNFTSQNFFFEFRGHRLPLPRWLSPGVLNVRHTAEPEKTKAGQEQFRFTLTVIHPLLGRVFFQDGVFHQEEYRP